MQALTVVEWEAFVEAWTERGFEVTFTLDKETGKLHTVTMVRRAQ